MTDSTLITRGWLNHAKRSESPNFDRRPAGETLDLIVIHHISLPPGYFKGAAIEDFFANRLDPDAHPYFSQLRDVQVSSHFLIRRHGYLRQLVSVDDRAWHAGRSDFMGRGECNAYSIGVELEGDENRPFTDSQYRTLEKLINDLRAVLPIQYIAGHSDISPGRKIDPGPYFDWSRLLASSAGAGLCRPQVAV